MLLFNLMVMLAMNLSLFLVIRGKHLVKIILSRSLRLGVDDSVRFINCFIDLLLMCTYVHICFLKILINL